MPINQVDVRILPDLCRIVVLLFNTLITKHCFIAEKLETIFIWPFLSPSHEITQIAGYLLTTDNIE